MTPPPALVLFDLDDVLCHYDRTARVRSLADSTGRSTDAVRQALWGSGLEDRADAGQLAEDAYLAELGERLGHRVTLEEWLRARLAAMTPNHAVLALAAQLAERGRIAVLTNNCRLVATHIGRLCPAVAEVFGDTVHASAEFGAAKPDPRVFQRCLAHLDAAPADTLFIDDLSANVAGAREAGLHGHHYTSADTLAAALRQHRLL